MEPEDSLSWLALTITPGIATRLSAKLLRELPTGSHTAPERFAVRNPLIAGMPLGVMVVEGKQFSGSLSTARLAMEFGREVFGRAGECDRGRELHTEAMNRARGRNW